MHWSRKFRRVLFVLIKGFDMRHGLSLLFVMTAMINLLGCGASTDTTVGKTVSPTLESETATTLPITTVESTTHLLRVAPPAELEPPVSALDIANVPPNSFPRDEGSGALKLSFADLDLKSILGITTMTEADIRRLPSWLKSLDGQKVRISGYMYPTFEEKGFDSFILAGSLRLMNFGFNYQAYELLSVKLASGTTTNYPGTTRRIEVIGTFRTDPILEDGKVFGLYFLENAAVVSTPTTLQQ